MPPLLLIFDFFQPPQTLLGPPCLLILRKLTLFTNPSFHFHSFLILFMPNFHSKIGYTAVYILVLCFMTTCLCAFHPCIII